MTNEPTKGKGSGEEVPTAYFVLLLDESHLTHRLLGHIIACSAWHPA